MIQAKPRPMLLTRLRHVGFSLSPRATWSILAWLWVTKQTASFWMCEDVFENFSDYHFRLVRTDGWFCLPHGDAKLGDAKRIG